MANVAETCFCAQCFVIALCVFLNGNFEKSKILTGDIRNMTLFRECLTNETYRPVDASFKMAASQIASLCLLQWVYKQGCVGGVCALYGALYIQDEVFGRRLVQAKVN